MKTRPETIWCAALAAASVAAVIAGCAGSTTASADSPQGSAGTPGAAAPAAQAPELSGAQLWAQNCALCHNFISPTTYSDAQWDVAVAHMRIQARLAGEEERSIRKFLQASN